MFINYLYNVQQLTNGGGAGMMKHINLICHFLFAVVVLLFVIFPPFYAIDTKSNGKIHSAMGYYPLWSTPASKDAYYCLVNNNKISGVVFENDSDGSGLVQYAAKFNTVRFITNFIIAAVVYLIMIVGLKRLRRQ